MTDEEIADEVMERLKEFRPALSVGHPEDLDSDQVEVRIVMSNGFYEPLAESP